MVLPKLRSLPAVSVQFLGTSSGGGPIQSRNCSSLAVDFGNEIWLFDTADGTLGRLHQSSLKIANITRIFITHLHVDHVLGLVPVLTTVLSGVTATKEATQKLKEQGLRKEPTFHIYGPAGLRNLVRTILNTTDATLSGVFAVHELLEQGQQPSANCNEEELHSNEGVGANMKVDQDGVWDVILEEGNGKSRKGWKVAAGPLKHRVPSLGYILQEPIPRLPLNTETLIPLLQSNSQALASLDPPVAHPLSLLSHITSLPPPAPLTLPSGDIIGPPEPSGVPSRKIVIFGDCSGGTENAVFKEMCEDASLLVHECTNASIPEAIQKGGKGQKARTRDLEPSLCLSRGVSTGELESSSQSETSQGKQVAPLESGKQDGKMDDQDLDMKRKYEVQKKAQSRGHSTPDEVGEFARAIKARRVIVNHFSAMFPAPRYLTSNALPCILSPLSRYPYPVPDPLPNRKDPPLAPIPLSSEHASELHVRLIMQSIADQILAHCGSLTGASNESEGKTGMVITSRDFMHFPLPSHELSPMEVEDVTKYKTLADQVTEAWATHGGMWIGGKLQEEWIGVEAKDLGEGWRFRKGEHGWHLSE